VLHCGPVIDRHRKEWRAYSIRVEEAVVLDQIARHHRIGHRSGEQLVDKASPTACDQSGSLVARKVSVKRSGMMLVPAEDSISRITAR
jgi:hypothetical protein